MRNDPVDRVLAECWFLYKDGGYEPRHIVEVAGLVYKLENEREL